MPLASSQPHRGLPVADVVATLGGGLLRVVVDAPTPLVDDITVAEPAQQVLGQAGDLVLGIGADSEEAATDLVVSAGERGATAVVLRSRTARSREVRTAARRHEVGLVELSDQASWAHVVWLLRGVLDRAAAGEVTGTGPIHDELFALADACAALLDAPVTIEDTQSRVLAYSSRQDVADPIRVSTIVGRKVPDAVLTSLRGRGVFRRLARSADPFFVPAAPDGSLRPRLVIPVRAGGEWLGSIWAVLEQPPPTEVLRSLTQTASVVALHLLRLRSEADLARRISADRLRALLSGDLAGADQWLPAGPWRVVALDARQDDDLPGAPLDLWESAFRRASWRRPLVATVDDQAIALVRDPGPPDLKQPAEPATWSWLVDIADHVATDHPSARAAAGAAVTRPQELTRSRTEAVETLRALTAGRVPGPTATVEQAWAPVTTDRAVSGIRTHALLGPVLNLRSHDAEHDTDYARTLAVWLDHPGDPRSAAARLHIHPNTLRYRMSRLTEVVDVDLADPEARLAMRLQLRALGH
ncbi:MAG: helix-turn-helix domain-containing protein [Intrasporangium sp.]|uniref:PucR family transcriptional regulator n=1 Tax=Intrasporangium sp. TaxID=1925024 RepID=UPI0026481D87|nr:PucR family transcriptional regulator [Intrasporangium sp.]MDN5795740.1 helix-turn-helix domain-containing protein [Intrasporangium sp.]